MIVIEHFDLPITVADKIVRGTRPSNNSDTIKAMAKALTGIVDAGETEDMYSLEDIKEIADYLTVYYNNHINGD